MLMPGVERFKSGWSEPDSARGSDDVWQDRSPYSAQPLSLWRESLVTEFLAPRFGPGVTALEVGPGVGEWTERVIGSVDTVMIADRRTRTLDGIRQRLGPRPDLREVHIVNNRLTAVPDGSVDFAYSLDFFPLVDSALLDEWLAELSRVLRPGGHLVVHHPATTRRLRTVAPRRTGLRATVTPRSAQAARAAAGRHGTGGSAGSFTSCGLVTMRQSSSWGPAGEFTVDKYRDVITVARKPTAGPG